jgi:mono/diheme cytochrome c family protein
MTVTTSPRIAACRRGTLAARLGRSCLAAILAALALPTAAARLETALRAAPHGGATGARLAHGSSLPGHGLTALRTQAAAGLSQTVAPGESGGRRSVRQGVFTAAQADRGRRLFEERCLACHQPDQYVGEGFMKSWAGQTADSLFDLLRTTMPQDNPGSLKPQAYADLLAYLFELNGLPPGDTELKAVSRALRLIVIEGPDKPPHR